MNSSNTNLEKIHAFDYLRAISCLFVIALHSNISCIFDQYQRIHSLLIFNLFDLAVPLFFQISLILFFLKREKQPDYFYKKSLLKLFKLYIFWGLFSQLFSLTLDFHKKYFISIKDVINSQISIHNLLVFILTDGNSASFYFFFSLFFLTALAELFVSYLESNQKDNQINSEVISYVFLIFSCTIVFVLPLIQISLGEEFSGLTVVFNPLNFIPYIFSSFLISKSLSQKPIDSNYNLNNPQIWSLITLYFSFLFIEWQYFNQPIIWGWGVANKEGLPIYSRVSLVLCSWLITLISFKITSSPPWIIKLISDFSLGIYCLHIFFILIIIRLFPEQAYPDYVNYLIFFGLLVVTIPITKLMRKFPIFQDII
ncbi:acyltransferase family protein [Calothrix sp. FACHB-1219]|uniref:acyltransferase family protein n=1 Tax=unclassified Calothrix TaxID=2619626 RepID=UPI0016845D67|nr:MULTISPECIES: acyltransferase family protein [unclassified Calothrix]MBD2202763.1 acyltransferase family protein [Calothrix sp. FACHB-168]MBD2218916.1 acyltransferase family protein [Calothrix sp. FACHB-1219]